MQQLVQVLTRVLGHYPQRGQILVDCGFTAITKQGQGAHVRNTIQGPALITVQAGHPSMIASVVDCPDLMLSNMTQEIGFLSPVVEGSSPDYSSHPVGSLLELVPYHACATAACHPVYYVHDSQGIVTEEWKPCRGW